MSLHGISIREDDLIQCVECNITTQKEVTSQGRER